MNISKKVAIAMLLCLSLSCSAAPSDTEFQLYWHKFRIASLTKDYTALGKLIHFPLEVRGVVDDMPSEQYSKNDLSKIFPKLMSQTVVQYQGGKSLYPSLLEVIKKIDKVTVAAEDNEVRVEQFEFKIINGKWYLVRAYLEEQ